jgi:DNA-binding transcriptional LysR family regulator
LRSNDREASPPLPPRSASASPARASTCGSSNQLPANAWSSGPAAAAASPTRDTWLAARAAQALASLGAAEEELGAIAGLQTGTIRLGASTAPGVYLLPDTLGCFRRSYPGVTVEVEVAASDEILKRLLAGRVQLALVGATRADDRIELDPFLEDEIIGVAKPGLLPVRNGFLAPARLDEFMLLAREPGSSSQQIADDELESIGITPAGVWELGSSEAVKRAAREGLGLAFLSRYAVAEEVERGDLESFRLAGRRPLVRHFSVARLTGRPLSPAERSFVDTLTSCCAKQADYAAACVGATPRRKRIARP